jgi:hypothetical protein
VAQVIRGSVLPLMILLDDKNAARRKSHEAIGGAADYSFIEL